MDVIIFSTFRFCPSSFLSIKARLLWSQITGPVGGSDGSSTSRQEKRRVMAVSIGAIRQFLNEDKERHAAAGDLFFANQRPRERRSVACFTIRVQTTDRAPTAPITFCNTLQLATLAVVIKRSALGANSAFYPPYSTESHYCCF